MQYVWENIPDAEGYSIDEVFIDLSGFKYSNREDYCKKLRKKILEKFGIPVSIGIAPSKALCKVANKLAKKHPEYALYTKEKIQASLENLSIGDIWGIGRRLSARFENFSIYTCIDFMKRPKMK